MKRLGLVFLCITFLTTSFALAEEAVILEPSGFNSLKVPETNSLRLERINQCSEISSLRRLEDAEYFNADDEVFETKAGQIFSKFVNDKVINNKLNTYSSKIEKNLEK